MTTVETLRENLKASLRVKQDAKRITNLFEGLVFYEKSHSYRFKDYNLVSASTFSSRLMPTFDENTVFKVAKKKGERGLPSNPMYYKQRWDFKRDEAANRGSRVHLFAEQYPTLDLPEDSLEQAVCDFYKHIENRGYEVVCMELRMTDGMFAGTCDLLLRNKKTGKYVIADWKTNAKDIEMEHFYTEHVKLIPFLKTNDKGKFTIQLNIYKMLLEKKGIEVEALILIHLNERHENNYKVIELPMFDLSLAMVEGEPVRELFENVKIELEEKRIAREAKYRNYNSIPNPRLIRV